MVVAYHTHEFQIPTASEAEVAAGTESGKVVTPATLGASTAFATAAQGELADTALQPADVGTAAAEDVEYFATAAQGALADTAIQSADLATVATSGSYADLTGLPTLGTAAAADTGDFATAAQGALADSALQSGVVNSDLADVATGTFKGRATAGTGDVEDLTVAQARTLLGITKDGLYDTLELDEEPTAFEQRPVYTPSTAKAFTRLLIEGSTENGGSPIYHRHFGSLVVDRNGNIHLFYRRALGHASYFEGVICHRVVSHNGYELGSETVISTNVAGWDLQAPMAVITPTGRIIVTCCHVAQSPSTSVNFASFYSDDYCVTWSPRVTFASKVSARTYGQPRIVPSDDAASGWKIIQPWYGPGTSSRRVGLYESLDGAETWAEGSVIYDGANMDLNECSVAVLNARVWFAAIRNNGGLLNWTVTTDAGSTWSTPVEVTWGSSGFDVAPSLDVITVDGIDHLLLGYCDRATDQTKWRWARASSLMTNAEIMGKTLVITNTTALGSASGYQVPYIYPNGQMLFVEFREYTYNTTIADPVGTDVHLVWAKPAWWCAGGEDVAWTPELVGKTTPGTAVYSNRSGLVSKRPNGEVTVSLRISLSSKGGLVGGLRINNLPYKVKNAVANQSGLTISFISGIALGTGLGVSAVAVLNSNNLDLYKLTASGSVAMVDTEITDSFILNGSLTYFTDE